MKNFRTLNIRSPTRLLRKSKTRGKKISIIWDFTHTHTHTHTHTDVTFPLRADPNFLTYFTAKGGPSIFEWSTLSKWRVLTRMYVILTRNELLFIYKMIREIISLPRADSGYPYNFTVKSWIFKDDESEFDAKTNSGPWACPLLVEGPLFACVEHAQCPLLAYRVCSRARTTSMSILNTQI